MSEDVLREVILQDLVDDVENATRKLVRFLTMHVDNDVPIELSLIALSQAIDTISAQAGELAIGRRLLAKLHQLREEQVKT